MSAKNAQEARDFITLNRSGTLSTLSVSHKGFPFGSLTPYDITPEGSIVICVSTIAEHFKNLVSDGRASLFVADPFGNADPQAHARATVLLKFEQVKPDAINATAAAYHARFPHSASTTLTHDFVFMKGTPERIRWIGGFGEIGWVDGAEFIKTTPDILAYTGMDAIRHMNLDHQDALRDYVKAFSSFNPKEYSLLMTHLHSAGFTITLANDSGEEKLEIAFPEILTDASKVREAMIGLLKSCRSRINTAAAINN